MGQSQITTRTVKRFLIATVTAASLLACCTPASAADEPFADTYYMDFDPTLDVSEFYVGDPESYPIYAVMLDAYFEVMATSPVEELTTLDDHYIAWLIAYDDAFGVDGPYDGGLSLDEATDIFGAMVAY